MGSIKLNNLKNTGRVPRGFTYVDLYLDIEEDTVPTFLTNSSIQGKDIKVSYDIDAIINSINNIFKTVPGERFLIPKFGANLRKYIFQPVTEYTAKLIGNEILRAITLWEPRVTVDRIDVIGRPELHEYEVTIQIIIEAMKEAVTLVSIINQTADMQIQNLNRICPTQ